MKENEQNKNTTQRERGEPIIYCIDIDGVLCDDMLGDYDNSTPDWDNINKVNKLYDEGHIIKIFTGRGSKTGIDWREFTEKQLGSWGLKYHELIFGKPVADIFIDDKAFNVRDWENSNIKNWRT